MKITKCYGTDCPLRFDCKRFTNEIDYPQQFFAHVPYYDNDCQMFWGEKSQSVWDQLTEIMNPNKNNQKDSEN